MRRCLRLIVPGLLALCAWQFATTATAAPVIAVSSTNLGFSGIQYATLSNQTITVTNTGNATLNYTINSDVFWLSVTNTSGSLAPGANRQHTVRVNTRGLAPRVYQGRLTIADPAAANSPKNVGVTLTVLSSAPPSMAIAWGDNSYGQANVPVGLTNVVATAGGFTYSSALKSDGTVVAWGGNSYGETDVPVDLTSVVAIAGGGYHSLALKADGTVVAYGYGYYDQTTVPADLTSVVAIAAGLYHSLALKSDGTVAAWGAPYDFQTDVPADLTGVVAIAAGSNHSLALKSDGTVAAWGNSYYGLANVPVDLTNVVAIAGGDSHSLALKSDGTVAVWGDNSYGQTNVPVGLTNVVAIAGGVYHSLALRSDGTVVVWGDNSYRQTNMPAGLTNVVAIAGGGFHSLALVPAAGLIVTSPFGFPVPGVVTNWVIRNALQTFRADPTIQGATQYVCSGWTAGSGSVFASGTSNIVTVLMTNDSSITWTWKTNYWLDVATVGMGTVRPTSGWYTAGSSVSITAAPIGSFAFVRWAGDTNGCTINGTNLTVLMTGPKRIEADFTGPGIGVLPTNLLFTAAMGWPSADQVVVITNKGTAAFNYNIGSDAPTWLWALSPTGTLAGGAGKSHIIRANTRGLSFGVHQSRLIVSAPLATNSPQAVSVVAAVPSSVSHTMIIAWGDNQFGQTNVPPSLTNAVAISGGYCHSLALKSDGTVVAWGSNDFGQTNVPAGLTSVVAIACGLYHSLALQSDGTVVAWGNNQFGQTDVPVGLTNIVAISGGYSHSLALKSAGTIVAWGGNSYGQTNVPAGLTNAVAIAAGANHSLALKSAGTVVAWGDNSYGQTNVPVGLTNIVAISGGDVHSLALRSNGTMVAWGANFSGQTNVPSGLTNVVAIAGGVQYSLALRSNGTVVAWGDNAYGQTNTPVVLTNAVAIGAGGRHSLALVPAVCLVVTPSPGSPTPRVGTNWVIRNTPKTLSASTAAQGSTQYVCTGWAGSGSVLASGTSNTVTVLMTNDSSITWTWKTNYWLNLLAATNGFVAPTSGWFTVNTNLQVQATPQTYYHLETWSGAVATAVNPLSTNVKAPFSVTARFAENLSTNTGTPEWWLATNGWTTDFDIASTNDTDGDGAPAWQEYLADTVPTNKQSALCITNVDVDMAGNVLVRWTGGRQTWQCLERTTNLLDTGTTWKALWSNPPPNATATNFTDSTATNQVQFYRVRAHR